MDDAETKRQLWLYQNFKFIFLSIFSSMKSHSKYTVFLKPVWLYFCTKWRGWRLIPRTADTCPCVNRFVEKAKQVKNPCKTKRKFRVPQQSWDRRRSSANSGDAMNSEKLNNPTNPKKRPLIESESDKLTTLICTVVAVDHTNLYYRVCSVCEKPLPDDIPPSTTHSSSSSFSSTCKYCNLSNRFNAVSSGSKRLFRVLVSNKKKFSFFDDWNFWEI